MSIRIFSKRSFAIGPGAQQGNPEIESFVTVPGAFQDMPEKYVDDPTFKLAIKAGEITVINNASVEKKFENDEQKAEVNDQASMSELEAFYEDLKIKNREDTIELGNKFGLEIKDNEKLGAFKKRIMEAYKLADGSEE